MAEDIELQGVLNEEEEALLREFEAQRKKDKKESAPEPPVFMGVKSRPSEEINRESGLTPEEEELLAEFENTREKASAARQKEAAPAAGGNVPEAPGENKAAEEKEEDTEERIQREIEEEILKAKKQIEQEKKENAGEQPEKETAAVKEAAVDMDEVRKKIEEETRERVERELKERIENETREKYEMYLRAKLENEIRSRIEKENSEKQAKILETLEKIHEAESKKSSVSEEEIKEKIKKEMEEERKKKQAALMSKLDGIKMNSRRVEEQKKFVAEKKIESGEIALSHTDRLILVRLFEEIQKILAELVGSYTDAKKVEKMFFKAADTAIKKNPEIMKKAITDREGRLRTDGSLETARIMANVNAYPGTEAKRSRAFFKGLRDVFEERLIACEIATDIDTRERITSELMRRMTKVFSKNDYNRKMGKIFMQHIMPDTSLQAEDD
ncbi:MAG TPA: hypothetical protein ENN55_03335 [Firmicutes bacterium]|nr:hypothetical protein [Bacillota bacterium]